MASRTIPSPADEPGKWLVLALALIGVGILPKRWEKGLSAAAAVVILLK